MTAQVTVRNPSGHTKVIEVPENGVVRDLKNGIREKFNVEPSQ